MENFMTSIPCNEGIMLTTSQLVFAFILLRHVPIQIVYSSFDQIVDRNHDLLYMMQVLLTISQQERYCFL